jgi:integrase
MRLTALQIDKLPIPTKGQKTYWDGNGFGVRVSQGGTKSFVVMYGTDRRLKTLGRYPAMTLKTARRAAIEYIASDTPQKRLNSLSDARTAFLSDCETRLRPATVNQYTFYLNKTDCTTLSALKRDQVDQSPHSIASWKAFYNWCIREELVSKNPFAFATTKYNTRHRVLTPDEIKAIWSYDHLPYSDYLKLQILTGQRIGQWKCYTVTDDTIIFPASIMKGKQDHTIPLTDTVAALLPIPQFAGWSKAKVRIYKHVPLPHWTLHDLRRTFSTICASLDIPLHVTERILSHSSGSISGVAAVYNRYNYLAEMRQALTHYEDHIKTVVAQGTSQP